MPVGFKFVRFIEAGDLFKDCPLAWWDFVRKGNCLRGSEITLIKASYLWEILRYIEEGAENGSVLMDQIEIVRNRMLKVPNNGEDFFINLEN